MIVADTGTIVALIDRGDRHHRALKRAFDEAPERWILPWAILPEVDYLVAEHVGRRARDAFMADLRDGAFNVAWGDDDILAEAAALHASHATLGLGLVDAAVIVTSIRARASAIATLDLKHFAAIRIPGGPKLLPRDLSATDATDATDNTDHTDHTDRTDRTDKARLRRWRR